MSSISHVYYRPTDPASVTIVSKLQLFVTPARIGTASVTVTGAALQVDGSWLFNVPTPADGVYYAVVTVTYTDGQTFDDKNDTVILPAPPTLAADELWVASWELDDPDSPYARDAALIASFIMYALSGRKYPGIKTVTERYTLPEISTRSQYLARTQSELEHRIGTHGFFYPTRDPRFRHDYVYLRGRPVRSVTDVRYGPNFDVSLGTTTYRVLDRAILEVDTGIQWETQVTYRYGARPPAMGRRAARELANEVEKSLAGNGACKLPERVRTITRQGTQITLLDPNEFLNKGKTGLYVVDLFLAAANPGGAKARPRSFSPDAPRIRRITG